MPYEYNKLSDISYHPSKWCHDMLPLQDEDNLQSGRLVKIKLQDILNSAKLYTDHVQIDHVFAINLDVLIAVSLKSNLVISYRYSEFNHLYHVYNPPHTEKWLDVVCISSKDPGSGNYRTPHIFSLLLLTEDQKIICLEMRQDSNKFVETNRVAISSKHKYTKLLLREPCPGDRSDQLSYYLWSPKRKMLQQFEFGLSNHNISNENDRYADCCVGKAIPIPYSEVKIRNPKLDGQEILIDGFALTLSIDAQNNSVLCADAKNHILFECKMKLSASEILCGRGMPGASEEHMQSKDAYLSSPCTPLVFRPQDYVEKERFSLSSKNILGATQAGRPRLILICDPGNQAVRKIWQFPNSPQAQDLANFDQINTLICDVVKRMPQEPLLQLFCDNPQGLYVNPCGLLTITTEGYAYIIASYSALPEQKTVQSNVPQDT